jgi:hypothetical protein
LAGFYTGLRSNGLDRRSRHGPDAAIVELRADVLDTLGSGEPVSCPAVPPAATCDALDSDQPPLRLPDGTDAEMITTMGHHLLPEFEAAMGPMFNLD